MPTVFTDTEDVVAARELAEAERADARHASTPEQAVRLERVRGERRIEDRVQAWRAPDS